MARDFGKVRTAFWADDKVIAWPERVKFVALYLLTSPHTNAIGCFRLPLQYVAADTGLSVKDATEAMTSLEQEGFLSRCPKTSFVFLRRFLEHNGIENANVAAHCIRLADEVPAVAPFRNDLETALKAAIAACKAMNKPVWEGFANPIERVATTVPKPIRIPEPEPEPEPEPLPEPEPEPEKKPEGERAAKNRDAPPPANLPVVSKPREKPTRWPKDAIVPDDWLEDGAAARVRHGLPAVDLRRVAEDFADYWAAEGGSHATKLDWKRTWLKWVRGQKSDGNGNANRQSGRGSSHPFGVFGAILEEDRLANPRGPTRGQG